MENFSFENKNLDNNFKVTEPVDGKVFWVDNIKDFDISVEKASSIYFNLLGNKSPSENEKSSILNQLKSWKVATLEGVKIIIGDNNKILVTFSDPNGSNINKIKESLN